MILRSIGEGFKDRVKFVITIDGPPGGSRIRLLETLRECGYEVKELPPYLGRTVAEVKAPFGEVNR